MADTYTKKIASFSLFCLKLTAFHHLPKLRAKGFQAYTSMFKNLTYKFIHVVELLKKTLLPVGEGGKDLQPYLQDR